MRSRKIGNYKQDIMCKKIVYFNNTNKCEGKQQVILKKPISQLYCSEVLSYRYFMLDYIVAGKYEMLLETAEPNVL